MKRALPFVAVLALAMPAAAAAKPKAGSGDLLGQWWKALLSLPTDRNPLAGTGDECLFLGHKVLAPAVLPDPAAPIPTCTTKPGTKLFIEGFTTECSDIEGPPFFGADYAEQVACARSSDAGISDVRFTIDGRSVPVGEVVSPPGKVKLPADNIFGAPAGTKVTFAAHGWNALVHPLRPGLHTVVVHALGEPPGFEPDVIYKVNVVPRGHQDDDD